MVCKNTPNILGFLLHAYIYDIWPSILFKPFELRGLERGIGKGCIGGFPVALHGFWGASGFGIDESTLKPETSNILLVYSPY